MSTHRFKLASARDRSRSSLTVQQQLVHKISTITVQNHIHFPISDREGSFYDIGFASIGTHRLCRSSSLAVPAAAAAWDFIVSLIPASRPTCCVTTKSRPANARARFMFGRRASVASAACLRLHLDPGIDQPPARCSLTQSASAPRSGRPAV